MYCAKCGAQNPDDAIFCCKCGNNTGAPTVVVPNNKKRNIIIAAVVCGVLLLNVLITIIIVVTVNQSGASSNSSLEDTISESQGVIKVHDRDFTLLGTDKEYVGKYTGEWENERPNGSGIFEISNNTEKMSIDGSWSNGYPEGFCTFNSQQTEGDLTVQMYYQGDMSKGVISGNGTLQIKTNQKMSLTYKGEFLNGDLFNGTCTGTDGNGNKVDVKIENGETVSKGKEIIDGIIDFGKEHIFDIIGILK